MKAINEIIQYQKHFTKPLLVSKILLLTVDDTEQSQKWDYVNAKNDAMKQLIYEYQLHSDPIKYNIIDNDLLTIETYIEELKEDLWGKFKAPIILFIESKTEAMLQEFYWRLRQQIEKYGDFSLATVNLTTDGERIGHELLELAAMLIKDIDPKSYRLLGIAKLMINQDTINWQLKEWMNVYNGLCTLKKYLEISESHFCELFKAFEIAYFCKILAEVK